MKSAVFPLRILQVSMIAFVIFLIYFSRAAQPSAQSVSVLFQWGIVAVACVDAVAGFVLQRMILRGPKQSSPASQKETPLARWRKGHIVRFAMAESVALFGFVLRMTGASSTPVYLLFGGGLLLLLFWLPGAVPTETEP